MNASFLYMLATRVHMHELQIANWFERPPGGDEMEVKLHCAGGNLP